MSLVRHWLVLAGLIWTRCAWLVTLSSARATFELNGPIMPSTLVSSTNCWTFCVPFCGSWTPLTASSRLKTSRVKPSTVFSWSTANLTPFRVGMPFDVSAPDSGKSTPILIVPLLAVPPPVDVPHAASARLTTASPASNLGSLIRVLLPNFEYRPELEAPRGVALYTTLPSAPATIGATLLIPINILRRFPQASGGAAVVMPSNPLRKLDNGFQARVRYATHLRRAGDWPNSQNASNQGLSTSTRRSSSLWRTVGPKPFRSTGASWTGSARTRTPSTGWARPTPSSAS